jgi:ABC-type nitrate/sulfonate/bicarbonate transport system ATPase subunit
MGTVTVEALDLRFNSRNGGQVIALNNLSLTVPDKQFAVIVGPSGCGKSSLLDIIAGLKEPTGGNCRLDGKVIHGPGKERGMVFQNYSLFPWLTVLKNVAFGPSLRGHSGREALERARHYVNAVGLSQFENAYPNQLSGGMKQRVAIARSLANDPEVILMDEPFGALDSQTRAVMQQLLLGIWEKEHKTILFVTHDIDEALFLGEKVYVMSARPGRIIDTISVEFPHPRSYELSTEPAFAELKRRIQRNLHGEVQKALTDAA